jgi:hypothetical protein
VASLILFRPFSLSSGWVNPLIPSLLRPPLILLQNSALKSYDERSESQRRWDKNGRQLWMEVESLDSSILTSVSVLCVPPSPPNGNLGGSTLAVSKA